MRKDIYFFNGGIMGTGIKILLICLSMSIFCGSLVSAQPNYVFDELSMNQGDTLLPTQKGEARLLTENPPAWYVRWKMMNSAKNTIDITYFSIYDDIFGKAFLGMLLKKAEEGVKIRLLIDGKGSYYFSNKGNDYLEELVANPNIEIVIFNSIIKQLLSLPDNIRKLLAVNHDKLMIIDDTVAITGGRNIGEAYFAHEEDIGDCWRDTDIVVYNKAFSRQIAMAFEREFKDKNNWKITKDWFFNLSSKRKKLVYAAEAMERWMLGQGLPGKSRDQIRWETETLRWYRDEINNDMARKRDISSALESSELEQEYYDLFSAKRDGGNKEELMTPYDLAMHFEKYGNVDGPPKNSLDDALLYLYDEGLIPARGVKFWDSLPFFKPDNPDMYNNVICQYAHMQEYKPDYDIMANSLPVDLKVLDSQAISSGTGKNDITHNIIALMDGCQEELIIQNPYVVLTQQAWDALQRANDRGVKIMIHTNSPISTDSILTQAFFVEDCEKLLKDMHNLRVFAFVGQRKMHSKCFVFDKQVSGVGTYNLDPISQKQNSEVVTILRSSDFSRDLRGAIMQDISQSKEYKLEDQEGGGGFLPQNFTPKKTMTIINFLRKIKVLRNVI